MENKKHFFYVLLCHDNTFYAGYTVEPERRLKEHNEGIGAKYTRLAKRRPVTMIHQEHFDSRSDAMKAEAAFKKLTRKKKEAYLEKKKLESHSLDYKSNNHH